MVFVCIGPRLLGWIEFNDLVRDTSSLAVKRAKQMGIEVVMLTGDNQQSAATVAEKVGITTVIANVKPDEKLGEIKSLQNV